MRYAQHERHFLQKAVIQKRIGNHRAKLETPPLCDCSTTRLVTPLSIFVSERAQNA